MADAFRVLAPDDDPASLGYPVHVAEHRSLPKALEAAKDAARAGRARNYTVLVEQPGTPNAWTVTYHPEAPVASGGEDADGLPVFTWPVEFRVTHDGTEASVLDLPGGPVGSGPLTGPRAALDVLPSGEEIPRDDAA